MLTRRNFFVVLIMFLVVFLMFMLVDVSAGYLTSQPNNPQADVPVAIRANQAFTGDMLDMDVATMTDLPQASADRPWVAIVASDAKSVNVLNMQEWCVYNRFRYQVFTQLPQAEQVADCYVMLFDDPIADAAQLPLLQAYAQQANDMIFTSLPAYRELQAAPELADFYGIRGFVQEAMPINGLYIFDEFFIGGERIYGLKDIYGDTDEDIPAAVPWYDLRAGYLMFIQAVAQDAGSKSHCIGELLKKGYDRAHVLMCGDAPGDLDAAEKNGVFYYPILVRSERESWEEFIRQGFERLLSGEYAGTYQAQKKEQFFKNLGA